jgi:hypothetical protein
VFSQRLRSWLNASREGPFLLFADGTSSLIAASDCAPTPIISINGHRPAASAEPPVIRVIIVPLASVMALTVTRSTDVNPNAIRADQHAAVTKRDMGGLHDDRHPAQQDDLVAPIKLIGARR